MTSVRAARLLVGMFVILALFGAAGPSSSLSFAQGVAVSITIAPPVLPVYVQPVCPGEGNLWTPGYWAWDDDDADYYWVPGTWVSAPEPGFLWTPGYWGWGDGAYVWNAGYWGEHVGFYGGVDYGFGYIGTGFEGGYWQGGNFFYNTSVMNVNRTEIHNVYTKTVIHTTVNRVSYNGGTGGLRARPTAEQEKYANERHIQPTSEQSSHQRAAASDRSLRASVNHGRPAVAASAKPGDFKTGAVAAKAGGPSYTRTANRADANRANENKVGAKPSKPAATEHAKARSAESKPSASTHASAAKHEAKPAKHASAARTKTKAAPAHKASAAKAESKPAKSAETEHASKPRTESKPAPAHKASTSKAESKPAKPAATERASASRPEARPAPEHEAAPRAESKPAAPAHHEAPARAESAPKPEHQNAPKAESKPAPAPKEKKPPR